jgi:hypothetical protein
MLNNCKDNMAISMEKHQTPRTIMLCINKMQSSRKVAAMNENEYNKPYTPTTKIKNNQRENPRRWKNTMLCEKD